MRLAQFEQIRVEIQKRRVDDQIGHVGEGKVEIRLVPARINVRAGCFRNLCVDSPNRGHWQLDAFWRPF